MAVKMVEMATIHFLKGHERIRVQKNKKKHIAPVRTKHIKENCGAYVLLGWSRVSEAETGIKAAASVNIPCHFKNHTCTCAQIYTSR